MSQEGIRPPEDRAAWGALSDEEVVRRVLDGDRPLYEVLVRRYNQRLFRVARAIVRDDAEAEDVMQQVYVQGYAHLAQFAGRAQFSTWLTRIAVYESLARARRRTRDAGPRPAFANGGADVLGSLRSSEPDPEQQAWRAEVRVVLESAIEAIPAVYRAVFVLREIEGLSTSETAECLDVTEDAVKTRLHRARGYLRAELLERAGLASASAFSLHLSRCDRVVAGVFARLQSDEAATAH
jgi:RNA polymerase sigma-70 factor (ECF subfamily)